MVLPYFLHILHYALEVALFELLENYLSVIWLQVDMMHKIFKNFVSVDVEKSLQQQVLIIKIVYFNQ